MLREHDTSDAQRPDLEALRVTLRDRGFRFRYTWVETHYRIYVLAQPSYGRRSDDPHVTHRDGDDCGVFVCTTLRPTTVEEARTIAVAWAERTMRYIRTGLLFEEE